MISALLSFSGGHSDLEMWILAAKISSDHRWLQVNIWTRFEEIPSAHSWDFVSTRMVWWSTQKHNASCRDCCCHGGFKMIKKKKKKKKGKKNSITIFWIFYDSKLDVFWVWEVWPWKCPHGLSEQCLQFLSFFFYSLHFLKLSCSPPFWRFKASQKSDES